MKKSLFSIVLILFLSGLAYSAMTMYFINVGQGDAEFIVLPNKKTVLIDGGPNKKAISAFIKAKKITMIDYLVLTHAHSDHAEGLKYVFDNCQVNNFYDTKLDNPTYTGDNIVRQKAATEPGCHIYYPAPGTTLSWCPNVTVKVLNGCPRTPASTGGNAINDSSIVLKITYNKTSAMFTGDIDSTIESNIIANYSGSLSAKILKVAHHGSAYGSSTAFLKKVKPKSAYISVGNNNYGHPDEGTISRLQAAGATVLRTDVSGTMSYVIP
ncbi:MAG: MBL fold metallo-hydrolase [Elusimicrobiota bacterium]